MGQASFLSLNPRVKVLLARHAECISNIYEPQVEGVGGQKLSLPVLEGSSRYVTEQRSERYALMVNDGNFLPDGLTDHGHSGASAWIERSQHPIKLDFNVTSGLARAVQTAKLVCNLFRVAEKHIQSHPGFREHTE